MTVCSIDGCERPKLARGWCSTHYKELRDDYPSCIVDGCDKPARQTVYCYAHYNRFRRHGDPCHGGPIPPRNRKGDGGLRNGYRIVTVDGRSVYEHRDAMEQIIGRPLLPFENVHHKNGIRTDNRPENLELWTKKQPYGQRVSDLVAFVVEHYSSDVLHAIRERERA